MKSAADANSAPSAHALKTALGPAQAAWDALVAEFRAAYVPLELDWKPAKTEFGVFCRLRQGDRNLVYLIPGGGNFEVAVVLGERAVALALESDLPATFKKLIRDARPYAEGRGIRFPVHGVESVPVVDQLVALKLQAK